MKEARIIIAGSRDFNDFGTVGMKLRYQALHIQNDLGNVFLYAGNRRELMMNSVDFN